MDKELQWEYRVQSVGSPWTAAKDEDLENLLNEWGEEGWEIFHIYHIASSNKARVIAKRPLAQSVRRERTMPSY